MTTEILLSIADILLAVIVFRVTTIHRREADTKVSGVEADQPISQFDTGPETAESSQSEHHAEVERQERFIDDWVVRFCDRAKTPEEAQHQRWEGLRHYNRSKR